MTPTDPPIQTANGPVVVIGSFNVDHAWHSPSLPQPGQTVAGDYHTGPGGKGFNQAIAARRAGAQTHFICALGDDAGARLAHALAQADELVLHAKQTREPTGTAGIYVDDAGRNAIVIGAGANAALDEAFVIGLGAIIQEAAVVLVQLETPLATVLSTLQYGRTHGACTILNPAPVSTALPAGLLASCDILTPNETELAVLVTAGLGQALDADAVAGLADASLHALCRRLLPHGTVVVTLGAAGSFVSHADHMRRADQQACYRMPAEPVHAIDTTGAGDAFNGALAAALAQAGADTTPFAHHVRFAGRYAALSTQARGGAQAMPSAAAVAHHFAAVPD